MTFAFFLTTISRLHAHRQVANVLDQAKRRVGDSLASTLRIWQKLSININGTQHWGRGKRSFSFQSHISASFLFSYIIGLQLRCLSDQQNAVQGEPAFAFYF